MNYVCNEALFKKKASNMEYGLFGKSLEGSRKNVIALLFSKDPQLKEMVPISKRMFRSGSRSISDFTFILRLLEPPG